MKVSEKAYIAALLDTDGSISIIKHKTKLNLRLSVKQNMKGLEMLEKAKGMAGVGNISKGSNSKYLGKPYPMMQWQVTDAQAKKLLLKVVPFMIRKKKQAEVGIAFGTMKGVSHFFGSRKDFTLQRFFNKFFEDCRELVMWLNAPPTETEREKPKKSVDDLWKDLRMVEKHFNGHATVQPTEL